MLNKIQKNKLDDCNFKQEILLDFTLKISTDIPLKNLLQKFEDVLRENLEIGKLLLYTRNVNWKPILVSGVDLKEYNDLDIQQHFEKKTGSNSHRPYTYINYKTSDIDIIIPVFQKDEPLAFLLMGDTDGQKLAISPILKHMKFIQILTNIVVVTIEKNYRYMNHKQQATIFKEMELASEIQNMLIPSLSNSHKFQKINIETFYLPHFMVGGDYYDAFQINSEELVFCVADVSGKGVPAALLLARFQANLKIICTTNLLLKDVVKALNEKIFNVKKYGRFITMFIACFNVRTNKLKYINVGHNPPIMYNKTKKKVSYLTEGCIGLGIMENIEKIDEGEISVEYNSKLLCYTDGLIELIKEGSIYTYDKEIEEYFCTDNSSKQSILEIIENMDLTKDNEKIFDDITMLSIDFNIENT